VIVTPPANHGRPMSHGDRPALGSGSRVVRSYAECAGRVARLAASLRQRFGLEAGERVAIVAKNSPDYLELMFGIWHAGLAAVPANAKLHGRELAYILEHSEARICFTSHGLDTEIAAHAPATLEHLITIGGAKYEALFATGPVEVWPCRGTDLAWLFYTSGTTGRPRVPCSRTAFSRPRATPMPPRSTRLRRAMRCCTQHR
jgi:long-chain acyl-CoA synthetase